MSAEPIGSFQILKTLGQGAHSTILHVRRETDGQEYALKRVVIESNEHRKFLDQARHEYMVAQRFDHPNLVRVLAIEEDKDWLFRVRQVRLLIEYVDGRPMDQLPPLRLSVLLPVLVQIASALVHMHRHGVLHADLKPNNLMLRRDGTVKVIDYGLAWIKGEPKNRVQGTPEYLAPETAAHKSVSERSEIYNFGATMYRLLTQKLPPCHVPGVGCMPVDAKNWKHLLKPVSVYNREAPPELCQLVERCLAYDPSERPGRMSEVQGELDQITDNLLATVEERPSLK